MTQTFNADEGAAGERLDVFLSHSLPMSRSQVQRLIRQGNAVTLDGKFANARDIVRAGSHVTIDKDKIAETGPTPEPPKIPIVYEDADVLVIDKPAGLTVHSGAGTKGHATVADFARLHTTDPDPERPGIVHRLDRNTSGLMLIAKTPAAKTYLQQQLHDHLVKKTYRALVIGHPSKPEATIDLPLDRDPAKPMQRAVRAGGRPAVTHYRTIESYSGYSLLEAELETGRTHQLRVHFAAIGHPIAGDVIYGVDAKQLGLKRQFLHATALELDLPSGQHAKFESPLSPDLKNYLSKLAISV